MTRKVFIAGISSDIGRELGHRFADHGWGVGGTYRSIKHTENFPKDWNIFKCDVSSQFDIDRTINQIAESAITWDLWISSIGLLEPIGPFFDVDFNQWKNSVLINCIHPLGLLRQMWNFRDRKRKVDVAFFAGAGTNGTATNYSAYCASKILLIKMIELLADECPDGNFFIIGPGMVKTRIHEQTLNASKNAGQNLEKVLTFLQNSGSGTSYEEIFECINWCVDAGSNVISGRNLALAGDSWASDGEKLKTKLINNTEIFKLRRFNPNK